MDTFSFYVPMDVVKSEGTSDDEWRIAGYASTDDEDRQGDTIVQKGLDYSDFINYGYFNYDHQSDKIVGYPDANQCRVDKHGFYVQGVLLHNNLAKSIWDTALELKRTHAPRHPGFSIEGKVVSRNPLGQIVKAKIYNVAITYNPVNPNATWDAVVKSFTSDPDDIDRFDKALSVGYGLAGDVGSMSGGSVIDEEDLDSALHNLSYAVGDNKEAQEYLKKLKNALNKRNNLTKSELILYFQLTKGLSRSASSRLVDRLVG